MAFVSQLHVFLKTLDRTGVQFPATKAEVISKLGTAEVQVSDTEFVKAASVVENFAADEFENGAAFLCAYMSNAYSASYKEFTGR